MKGRVLLRGLGLAVLVFGAVWVAMLWRWRAANRVPNGADITLWLVALPAALLLGLAVVFWGVRKARKRRQQRTAKAASGTGATPGDAPATDDPTLAWQVPVLAADAVLAAGDSPAALVAALREGQRVELHPVLKDAAGLPVFAAEVAGLDLDTVTETLPEAARNWHAARKRTLALAQTLAARMLDANFDSLRDASTSAQSVRAHQPQPRLHIEWLLPADWSNAERDTARDWLAAQLAQQGWNAPELAVDVQPVDGSGAALKRLDDVNRAFHATPPPLPRLLLASDSRVDDATIAAWDAAHQLQGGRHPEGRVPGEGAAAVLLSAPLPATNAPPPPAAAMHEPALAGALLPPAPIAHLHRLFAAQRARPAGQPGRLDSSTLQDLAGQAAAHAALAPDALAHLVGDTGVRASRTAEAMHFAQHALPDADPATTLLALGTANGDCGAALALGAVVVAVHLAGDTRQPALVFSNHDAVLRCAAAIAPPSPAADAGAAPMGNAAAAAPN